MRLAAKQRGFSNKLIIKKESLFKPFALKQLPKEIHTFYFFIPN